MFFEDKKDYEKAELCYKSALESLDEEHSNQMYRRIDDQPGCKDQLSQTNIIGFPISNNQAANL